jgi:hypothetical protein
MCGDRIYHVWNKPIVLLTHIVEDGTDLVAAIS